MDAANPDALGVAFRRFDADSATDVACPLGRRPRARAGWDSEYATSLKGDRPLAVFNVPAPTSTKAGSHDRHWCAIHAPSTVIANAYRRAHGGLSATCDERTTYN